MKKIIILLFLSLLLAGGLWYQLTREGEDVSPHALPSPHIAEEETLFFTNLDIETLTSWTLQSHTERLSVEKNAENIENVDNIKNIDNVESVENAEKAENIESVENIGAGTDINIGSAAESHGETNSSPPSTWTFSYTKLSPQVEDQGRQTQLKNLPADQGEALANARNFLSLAYVNEDLADTSPLKTLSGKKNLSPNDPDLAGQTVYTLTWTSFGESATEVFIEGEAATPLRKLYYGGKAFWVREWYILALKRSPNEMYPKDFLSLSAHTLDRIEQKVLAGAETSTPNFNPNTSTIDSSTNGFTLALTAPYTWSLLPPSAAAGNNKDATDTEETLLQPEQKQEQKQEQEQEIEIEIKAEIETDKQEIKTEIKAEGSKAQRDEVTTKINAFIETLLFLRAESALLLHLDEEIKQLKSSAHTTIMLTLTSRRPASASPRQEILTLYAHRDHLYATVSTYPDIFYRLPTQKSLSALQYSYKDFLP